jgi:hypothetical protein
MAAATLALAALALGAALAGPAWAQDPPTKPARDLLGLLPMPALVTDSFLFLDLSAVRAAGLAGAVTDRGIVTWPNILGTPITTDLDQPGSFAAHAGFRPDQIDRVAVVEVSSSLGPLAIRLHDADPGALARTWVQQGYAETDAGDTKVWTRVPPDENELGQADLADPLRNVFGTSAALEFDDSTLLMAEAPPALAAMKASAKRGDGAASRIDLQRMLDALDRTLAPKEMVTQLVWMPVPDAAGDAAFEAATATMTAPSGPSPDATKDAFIGATGIPSYPSLLLGEIREAGQTPSALLAVLFADCAIADHAGAVAGAKWQAAAKDANSPAAAVFGRMTARWASIPVDGGCVLLGRTAGSDPDHPALAGLYGLSMRRGLSPLYVGRSPQP